MHLPAAHSFYLQCLPSEYTLSNMEKALIVWHRFGKEHREDAQFRRNPPELVQAGLQAKAEKFRRTPPEKWCWWRVSDDLLLEKPGGGHHYGPDTRIYYLPKRNWVIIENIHLADRPQWTWYIHIGQTRFDPDLGAWVFKDLFADVLLQADCRTHTLLDLDDLAQATEIGLLTSNETASVLRDTQALIDLISQGHFPPLELKNRQRLR